MKMNEHDINWFIKEQNVPHQIYVPSDNSFAIRTAEIIGGLLSVTGKTLMTGSKAAT